MTHKVDPSLKKYDHEVYNAMVEYWQKIGKSPSQIELRDAVLCSITTVIQAIKRLEDKGYLTRIPGEYRTLQPTDWDLTLSKEPIEPWAELTPKIYWKTPDWSKS